jgi:aryl-alcohol dehydrogenase-like predicted oxidoreductase
VLSALRPQEAITRAIPSTGERIPVIGLGGANTFSAAARNEDIDRLTEVLRTLVENGATVLDTAPGYGASEEVAGRIAQNLGIAHRIFWATKLNVAGRGGGAADHDEARAQVERSFERLRVPVIDLSAPTTESIAALDAACRDHGFFLISGPGGNDLIADYLLPAGS